MINSSNGGGGADAYTDLSSVNAIRTLGRSDKNQALEKIAQQFESMMVQMMMKSMREANAAFSEGSMFSSPAGDMYEDMYDDQIALSLSQGRGLGVAEVMVRQLRQRFGEPQQKAVDTGVGDYMDRKIPQQVMKAPAPSGLSTEAAASVEQPAQFDGSVAGFVDALLPLAQQAAAKLGIDPEVLLAQSALETGWGKKVSIDGSGQSSNNMFNIKADKRWPGATVQVNTVEFNNGVPVPERASFRAYNNAQHSFDDYVAFVSESPRYSRATSAQGSEQFVRELSAAGYATDPQYADKIIGIINSAPLQQALASAQLRDSAER
ncbi:MAG: flagellar protein FlgJ [Paraglaciecola psychrophila]|jgi:flagellar protein FlgJ